MRNRFALKALGLVAAGVASSLLTTWVINSTRKVSASPQVATPVPREKIIAVYAGPGSPAPLQEDAAKRVFGSSPYELSISGMAPPLVEVNGRKAHIKASAWIQDNRPNMRYVWAVQVLEPGPAEKVVYQKVYDDQVFEAPERQRIEPTFEDVVDLPVPNGSYALRIGAFVMAPGLELTKMRFDRTTLRPNSGALVDVSDR